jgi:hypothetical protein
VIKQEVTRFRVNERSFRAARPLSRRKMGRMGRRVTKPQGYRRSASEQLLCVFVLCLPYYQSLLFAGMSGMISFLLLTVLLMFVVARSPAIYRIIITCLKDLPQCWAPPTLDGRNRRSFEPLFVVAAGPSLVPTFQRPPPLFS